MDQFDIQPYVGVGLLKFGMKREEVEKILGQSDDSEENISSNEIEEFREENSLQLTYSGPNRELIEISLYAYANIPNVKFGDIDIFKIDGEEAMKYLIEADGNPLEIVGIVILLNLGISLGGFMHDDEPGEKNITAFAKGRMNKYLDRLKPYKPKFQKRKK